MGLGGNPVADRGQRGGIGGVGAHAAGDRGGHRAALAPEIPAIPVATGDADPRVGRRVSIAPTDYGTVPVTGTLVAATPSRYVVARETDRFGTVHVHFPKRGFSLTSA